MLSGPLDKLFLSFSMAFKTLSGVNKTLQRGLWFTLASEQTEQKDVYFNVFSHVFLHINVSGPLVLFCNKLMILIDLVKETLVVLLH